MLGAAAAYARGDGARIEQLGYVGIFGAAPTALATRAAVPKADVSSRNRLILPAGIGSVLHTRNDCRCAEQLA